MSVSTNWKTLSKKELVSNKYISLWEDTFESPDGRVGTFYLLRRAPFSIVIPIHADKVVLVQQFRYTVQSLSWEFPMGYVEGKSPHDTAVTELKEETGITAESLTQIGKFWLSTGRSNQEAYVYVAEGLAFGDPKPEEFESFEMKEFSIDQVRDMIRQGNILDGPSITSFHFLQEYLTNKP